MRKERLSNLSKEVQEAIIFDQPRLTAELREGSILVFGSYLLKPKIKRNIHRGPIAEYQVSIQFPASFPKTEPVVHEIGNTIPRDANHHINPDGTCCIVVWEAWASPTKNISVKDYFDGPLRNYFLGQHQKTTTGIWPFGEEPHGKEGLIVAYADKLSCKRIDQQVRYLLRLFSKDWPKGHWDCPCGSGKIIRKCCAQRLADLAEKVPKQDAKRMLSRLRFYDRDNLRSRKLSASLS